MAQSITTLNPNRNLVERTEGHDSSLHFKSSLCRRMNRNPSEHHEELVHIGIILKLSLQTNFSTKYYISFSQHVQCTNYNFLICHFIAFNANFYFTFHVNSCTGNMFNRKIADGLNTHFSHYVCLPSSGFKTRGEGVPVWRGGETEALERLNKPLDRKVNPNRHLGFTKCVVNHLFMTISYN